MIITLSQFIYLHIQKSTDNVCKIKDIFFSDNMLGVGKDCTQVWP